MEEICSISIVYNWPRFILKELNFNYKASTGVSIHVKRAPASKSVNQKWRVTKKWEDGYDLEGGVVISVTVAQNAKY